MDKVTDEPNLLSKLEDWSQVFSQEHTMISKSLSVLEPLETHIILHKDIHNIHVSTTTLFTDSLYMCIISEPAKHTISGLLTQDLTNNIKDKLTKIYQSIYNRDNDTTTNLQYLFDNVCYNQSIESTKLGDFYPKTLEISESKFFSDDVPPLLILY